MAVSSGEAVLVYGTNGSGKSTLLKSVLRLHRKGTFSRQDGVIRVSQEVIGYLGQRPQTQILTFKVEEELVTPLSFRGESREYRHSVIADLSKRFGIEHLRSRDPHSLSSGQTQFILGLVNFSVNAELLLLDEPMALLDNENRRLLIESLLELKNQGIGMVISSHNLYGLNSLIDRSYVLMNGRLHPFTPKFPHLQRQLQNCSVVCENNFGNLVLGYDEVLLRIPNLQLPDVGVVLIIGKNGSGKTLFLLTLSGVLEPLRGKVPKMESYLVIQDTHLMYWRPSLQEEWDRVVDHPPVDSLSGIIDRSPLHVSPGELKQFSTELAFATTKQVILLDEPTYSLDSKGKSRLLELIVRDQKSRLILLSSNDLVFCSKLVSKGVVSVIMDLENYRVE